MKVGMGDKTHTDFQLERTENREAHFFVLGQTYVFTLVASSICSTALNIAAGFTEQSYMQLTESGRFLLTNGYREMAEKMSCIQNCTAQIDLTFAPSTR